MEEEREAGRRKGELDEEREKEDKCEKCREGRDRGNEMNGKIKTGMLTVVPKARQGVVGGDWRARGESGGRGRKQGRERRIELGSGEGKRALTKSFRMTRWNRKMRFFFLFSHINIHSHSHPPERN